MAVDSTAPPAVILAAGEGSRLSAGPKPMVSLLGLSLAERTVATCMAAGVRRFIVVLGHRAVEVKSHFEKIAERRGCTVEFVTADNWRMGNGASALAAAKAVGDSSFLLMMTDHLIAPSLITAVLDSPPSDGEICLAVDRNREGIFDQEDVTRVGLSDGRVTRIGKGLEEWDAGDTGVFLCTPALFERLESAAADERHSLTDGVTDLANDARVRAVEVTGKAWIDVDTPEALREARRRLLSSIGKGGEDGYVSAFLNRPLSVRLSSLLVKTPVTPNQITVVSFLMSLGGAALLASTSYALGAVGGLLVQISSVIDGCDGEVARLKHQTSEWGAWFDTMLDRYADLAVAIAITFAYTSTHPEAWPWIAGMVAAVGFILTSYVTKEFALRYGHPYPNNFLNRLKRRDLRLLGICIGALVGRPFEALLILGALSHLCVGVILLHARNQAPSPKSRNSEGVGNSSGVWGASRKQK